MVKVEEIEVEKTKEERKKKENVYVVAMPYGITDMYFGLRATLQGKLMDQKRNKTRNLKIEVREGGCRLKEKKRNRREENRCLNKHVKR